MRTCLSLLLLTVVAPAQDRLAVKGLDPVELCQGREVQGEAGLSERHFLYEYRFANEANRQAFAKDPDRFGIQMGGGCARMGPLSGRGNPERFAVHDSRLYIFASEQCRSSFLKDPARYFPPAEQPIDANEAARKAGAALLARAKGMQVPWQTVRFEQRTTAKTREGERLDTETMTVARDGRLRIDQAWGDYRYGTVMRGDSASFLGSDGKVEPVHATGVRELQLRMLREPLVLFTHTAEPGFQAAAAGTAKVGDQELQLVEVFMAGARTTIGIDPEGRIRLQRYRGRGPQLWFGTMEWTLSDFRKVGASELPFRAELSFDGKPQPDSTRQLHAIELDPKLAEDCFAPKAR